MGTIKKEFVCSTILGDYYSWNIYKITDARNQIWFVAEPTIPSATRIADTIEELKGILEKDVARLIMLKKRERGGR